MPEPFTPKPLPPIPPPPRTEEQVVRGVLVTRDVADHVLAYLQQQQREVSGTLTIADERGQYESLDALIDGRGYAPPTLTLTLVSATDERIEVEIDRAQTRLKREGLTVRPLYNEILRILTQSRTQSRMTVLAERMPLGWALSIICLAAFAAFFQFSVKQNSVWDAIGGGAVFAFMVALLLAVIWGVMDWLVERLVPTQTGPWLIAPKTADEYRIRAKDARKNMLIGSIVGFALGVATTLAKIWLSGD